MSNSNVNTYTQIHIQFIFAVKFRNALINKSWKEDLHKYITGIVQKRKHKMVSINTEPDHLHMLVGFRPDDCMSDLIKIVKKGSQDWIDENKLTKRNFEWQGSFAALSYSKSQIPRVIKYIENQQEHHKKQTFLEEYKAFLKAFGIDYDERYIFKDLID